MCFLCKDSLAVGYIKHRHFKRTCKARPIAVFTAIAQTILMDNFETRLSGGHPNSLGNTIEVVNDILKDKSKLEELYRCYFSTDEIVRLRVSNAMKRVAKAHPDWLVPYLDKFISEISKINQPSTQWTLAQLFMLLDKDLTPKQKAAAIDILKRNLTAMNDWIVLNFTMEALTRWAKDDEELMKWLKPHLEKLAKDPRNSVKRRAAKFHASLYS